MSLDPATPLRGLPFAAIDFESTGFAGPDAHVVEVAVAHGTLGEGDARVVFHSRVRPPVAIPEAATRVHGITDADVASSPVFSDIADQMIEALAGRVIVAYNAPADFTFAAVELARMGRPPLAWPWLDLLVVRKATKTRGRPGRLEEVAAEYGLSLDAHGAAGDALTAALLLTPMMRAAWTAGAFSGASGARSYWSTRDEGDFGEDEEPPRIETWGSFVRWQREAALDQERDFAAYRRRQGDSKPPQSAWHVIEGVDPPSWEPPRRVSSCPDCCGVTVQRIGQNGALARFDAETGAPHVCPEPF